MKPLDSLIIGAGMAGLTAARVLTQNSRSLLVLDKSRGVGGRVATRRLGDARADHGAACFRLQNEKLASLWKSAWERLSRQPAPPSLESGAWTCSMGMSALPKALADGLPIELQQTVTALNFQDGLWHCQTREGLRLESQTVLLTSPLWQSADFFRSTDPDLCKQIQDLAQRASYAPQWTLIIKLAPGVSVHGDAYQAHPHRHIASAYDQGRKGLPQSAGVWVVQASRGFSTEHGDADASFILEKLAETLRLLGWNLQGAEIQAHRWRYGFVQNPLLQECIKMENSGLYLAGDFCLGSMVEGAALSGYAAAEGLLTSV